MTKIAASAISQSRTADSLTREPRYVLVFDICSSTSILEDLLRSENEKRWRDLIIEMKNFMIRERNNRNFEIYKFMGDGWILLFDIDFPPADLFELLKRLCEKYDAIYKRRIRNVLSIKVNIGLTFGLEKGTLIHFVVNHQKEYIGRAINVAARLQGATKDGDSNPEGKVLMSKAAYHSVRAEISQQYRASTVVRTLRNIAGGEEYHAIKLSLFEDHSQLSVTPTKAAES